MSENEHKPLWGIYQHWTNYGEAEMYVGCFCKGVETDKRKSRCGAPVCEEELTIEEASARLNAVERMMRALELMGIALGGEECLE